MAFSVLAMFHLLRSMKKNTVQEAHLQSIQSHYRNNSTTLLCDIHAKTLTPYHILWILSYSSVVLYIRGHGALYLFVKNIDQKTDSQYLHCALAQLAAALKPGRVNRVTFSPDHPGLTRFTNYPGLTRIGSRGKQNCSFDDVETYKRYRVALS